jgi:hypothetical protein
MPTSFAPVFVTQEEIKQKARDLLISFYSLIMYMQEKRRGKSGSVLFDPTLCMIWLLSDPLSIIGLDSLL